MKEVRSLTTTQDRIPSRAHPLDNLVCKTRNQISVLKSDCNLLARLYIACQAREGNLQEFFRHENHGSPPALSCAGKMRSGQKSELVQWLEASTTVECPDVDVKVIDAAAVVNMLPPGKS